MSSKTRYIMRLPQVEAVTGYRRSSIYKFMTEGSFPQCYPLGRRAVGWDSVEVENWIHSKLKTEASQR